MVEAVEVVAEVEVEVVDEEEGEVKNAEGEEEGEGCGGGGGSGGVGDDDGGGEPPESPTEFRGLVNQQAVILRAGLEQQGLGQAAEQLGKRLGEPGQHAAARRGPSAGAGMPRG